MPRLAAAVVLLFALTPSVASAATVGGKTRSRDGTPFGTMHYRSGPGVANRVAVLPVSDYGELMVVERAERLRARGECRQVDRHSAICPWSESDFAIEVVVGSRTDHVRVAGKVSARVRGGGGDDVLKGNGDELHGDRGRDLLLGGPAGFDRLHGGRGRDRMEGRGAERFLGDYFFDDETDAQAARDVVVAGKGPEATMDYSLRTRDLRLDLRRSRLAPEGDRVRGVTGLNGGSGDDVLIGNSRLSRLEGGEGDDRLYGRDGADVLDGGHGDDLLRGGDGNDRLSESVNLTTGSSGADRFVGGAGADTADTLDDRRDDVRCDARDRPVESDPNDRLRRCVRIRGWDIGELELRVQPQLTADAAIFTLRCGITEMEQREDPTTGSVFIKRCRGQLTVRGADGAPFGSQAFTFEMVGERTPYVTVTVPLTPAGREAIRQGAVVQVEAEAFSANGWRLPTAGYRTFMQG